MAITRVKTSSILQNFPKERSMLAGNDSDTGAFESIATVTVGAGGASTIDFNSIPSTYQHLQIRCIARTARADTGDELRLQLNADTTGNYSHHQLEGDGATPTSGGTANASYMAQPPIAASSSSASIFGTAVIDILDYKDTNKYTTIRGLGGFDRNGGGYVSIRSGNWRNTEAVSSIKIYAIGNLEVNSTFALYGIR